MHFGEDGVFKEENGIGDRRIERIAHSDVALADEAVGPVIVGEKLGSGVGIFGEEHGVRGQSEEEIADAEIVWEGEKIAGGEVYVRSEAESSECEQEWVEAACKGGEGIKAKRTEERGGESGEPERSGGIGRELMTREGKVDEYSAEQEKSEAAGAERSDDEAWGCECGKAEVQLGSEVAREQRQTLRQHGMGRKVPVVWPELRAEDEGSEARE